MKALLLGALVCFAATSAAGFFGPPPLVPPKHGDKNDPPRPPEPPLPRQPIAGSSSGASSQWGFDPPRPGKPQPPERPDPQACPLSPAPPTPIILAGAYCAAVGCVSIRLTFNSASLMDIQITDGSSTVQCPAENYLVTPIGNTVVLPGAQPHGSCVFSAMGPRKWSWASLRYIAVADQLTLDVGPSVFAFTRCTAAPTPVPTTTAAPALLERAVGNAA